MDARQAILATALLLMACHTPGVNTDDMGPGPGGQFAFVDPTGSLAVAFGDGSSMHELTPPDTTSRDPMLSGNGTVIVLAYDPAVSSSMNTGIWQVLAAAGSAPVLLAAPPAGFTYSSPTWDQTFTNVYFVSTGGGGSQILKVPLAGGATEVIRTTVMNPRFIAIVDDATLAISAGTDGDLNLLTLQNGLVSPVGASTNSRFAASPDGTRLAYVKAGVGLVVRTISTDAEVMINPAGAASDVNPAFSTDSTFVSYDDGTSVFGTAADGTGKITKLFTGSDASWGN